MQFHPHIHFLAPGGGLNPEGEWVASRDKFLVHTTPLAIIFRAKLRDELKEAGLFERVDKGVWEKKWVVDCEPVGTGEAAFKYLAPYIFRVAISNNRIEKLEDGKVTFKYKESATDQVKRSKVTAEEFIRRFLQHVLPRRFVKIRYYGLLASGNRALLDRAREKLNAQPTKSDSTEAATEESRVDDELPIENEAPIENKPSVACERTQVEPYSDAPRCPLCGTVLIRGRRIEAVPRGERRLRIPPSAFITQAGRSPP
jgi:hypothetical protein